MTISKFLRKYIFNSVISIILRSLTMISIGNLFQIAAEYGSKRVHLNTILEQWHDSDAKIPRGALEGRACLCSVVGHFEQCQ